MNHPYGLIYDGYDYDPGYSDVDGTYWAPYEYPFGQWQLHSMGLAAPPFGGGGYVNRPWQREVLCRWQDLVYDMISVVSRPSSQMVQAYTSKR
jgi:hypothetical protein